MTVGSNGLLTSTCGCGARQIVHVTEDAVPEDESMEQLQDYQGEKVSLGTSATADQISPSSSIIKDGVEHMLVADKESKVKKIVIMGNIGAGKTTFHKKLQALLNSTEEMDNVAYGFCDESLKQLQDYHGVNVLDMVYRNMISGQVVNAIALQHYMRQEQEILRESEKGLASSSKTRVIISDRDMLQVLPFIAARFDKDSVENQILGRALVGMIAVAQRIPTAAIIYVRAPWRSVCCGL